MAETRPIATRAPVPMAAPLLLSALFSVLLGGCGGEPETGPVAVEWDRDTCERCRMLISERGFAAQVRGGPDHRAYKFDDFGDAVLWLREQRWRDDPGVEIWVADYHTGEWLDARTAKFISGLKSPMSFGLGAVPDQAHGTLDFDQAVRHVLAAEQARRAEWQ